MITVRIGVALSLLIAIAALAVAVLSLMGDIRSNNDADGRVVQTGITNRLTGDPVEFSLDDFFMSPDGEGQVNALYAYPPGFSGSIRGCKVVWQRDATVVADGRVVGPGLFTDPCTGAHFDSGGNLIDGAADRGLDRFAMTPEPEGLMVDTRTLLCGPSVAPASNTEATATPTPVTCKRVARAAAR
ncbi:MAG TPA: hypothetical protein VFY79_04145 [Dehalococcoidia bacterium]|nr:hypothetical protein [Dehalococcoidia bacterium]